jgi:hypothetical protein
VWTHYHKPSSRKAKQKFPAGQGHGIGQGQRFMLLVESAYGFINRDGE